MKTFRNHILFFIACYVVPHLSPAQGKVVINEYMPWPSNGCGVTAEFVELLNFGPGPVDISCYILTDGDYSVTIPPQTILHPGQYYVIAGQNAIPAPCANIASDVLADLNWNTCGCTNAPIPTTGHGFFTDGGGGSEQIVLLDPTLKVIDAVIRDLPVEPSALITTTGAFGCTPQTFDLDLMNIPYETLGMSTGNGNSFARKLDGDCGWVKDPQQSAGATNNTPSDVSDISYQFSYVNAMECKDNYGSVSIFVRKTSYSDVFPMRWSLGQDIDLDGDFDFNDQFTYGVDSTAPDIFISGLTSGRYRLTVESSLGCYLKNFDFQILPCSTPLAVSLKKFTASPQNNNILVEWSVDHVEELESIVLEKSTDQVSFVAARYFGLGNVSGSREFKSLESHSHTYFRLKFITRDNKTSYSPVITIKKQSPSVRSWPNPADDHLNIEWHQTRAGKYTWQIINASGMIASKGQIQTSAGINQKLFNISSLQAGIYQLVLQLDEPVSFRFVKH